MPLPPLKVPIDSSTFSPLVIKALKILPKFYLYPSPFPLEVVDSTTVTVEWRIYSPHWKCIPWFLNVFFLIGFLFLGSCLYVCFGPVFINVGFEISTPNRILNYGFVIFPFLCVAICWVLMRRPGTADLFNYVAMFEMECEYS